MTVSSAGRQRLRRGRSDEGSALLLVLVFVTVASLLALPLLTYATTISRQNNVLSSKTSRQEAVKAGLRTALAEPSVLYSYCGDVDGTISGPSIDGIPVETTCEIVDSAFGFDPQEIHLGVVATRVGELVPENLAAVEKEDADGNPVLDGNGDPVRLVYEPTTTDPQEWLDSAADYAPSSVSTRQQIWAPNLPVHSANLRGPSGFDMPAGFPTCKVYFPGTYRDEVKLIGPTYFTSGIYYFEDTVTVKEHADVVGGTGEEIGCTTDQEAAFYATNAPAVHSISGAGVTFIFGSNASNNTDGRLIVTNERGPTSIRLNQRYVAEDDEDALPSYGVSIASVNGKLVGGPNAGGEYQLADLDVAGVNYVPYSQVGVEGGATALSSAGKHKMQPSRLTHEPRPPSQPRWDAAQPLVALRTGSGTSNGAVRVRWQEPENLGGLPVDGYVVTASGGQTCVPTVKPLECVVTGLTSGTNYTFTVTAQNEIGTSSPSPESATARPLTSGGSASPMAAAPATPAAPTAERHPDNTVVVSWAAPADNNLPITKYEVTASPALDPVAQPCVMLPGGTSCMIRNLPMLDPDDPLDPLDLVSDYVFQVTATNELGTSAASPASSTSIPPTLLASPADPDPVPPVVVAPYEPDPIVDINLPATHRAVIDIPGYISVPQGILRVVNPHGLGTEDDDSTVDVTGGIMAAALRVDDPRDVPGPLLAPIGIVNPLVQRTFRITSTTTSGTPVVTSTAIVQINQNGAYAVNSWVVQ